MGPGDGVGTAIKQQADRAENVRHADISNKGKTHD